MSRLDITDLSVAIDDHVILSGLQLALEGGQVTLIRGRSGAGKSTLLRAVAGQQEGRVSGQVSIEGAEPRRARVGWVPQDRSLWSHMSLMENVAFVGRNVAGLSRLEAQGTAMRLLSQLGLAEQVKQFPNTLSGGQSRRGGLARTLIANPVVLLLDEVTSGLDPQARHQTFKCVQDAATAGSIVVMTSHDAEDAAALPKLRTYLLKDGHILEGDGL